ncbi:MAG: outer membrane beta-barrel protein [Pseudomonadota bacterium]
MKTAALSLGLMAMATPAFAGDLYVKAFGGYTLGSEQEYGGIDFDTEGDFSFGGAVGLAELLGPLDIEVDVLHTDREFESAPTSLSSTSVMANAVFRFDPPGLPIGPYVGAGVGMINTRYDGAGLFPALTGDDWTVGWQALAGAEYQVSLSPLRVFAEWRYQQAGDAEIQGIDDIEYSAHSILGGVRFEF